jgi:hypothetical protein
MRLSGTIATKDSFAKRIIKATGVRIRKRKPVVNKEA